MNETLLFPPSAQCRGTWNDCCTSTTPCVLHDGDCDDDSQCVGDLVCGRNNCGVGFPKGADCCMKKGIKLYHL